MIAGRLTARRLAGSLAGATAFLVVAATIALFVGLGPDGLVWLDTSTAQGHQIFHLTRLPRAMAAAIAGAGLAASGVAFQAILRNPLAEPYTLGVSPGAGLGAVVAIRLGMEALAGSTGVAACAFAGSLAVVFLVWRVARVGSSRPPATLILAGITLAFLCSAASMFIQYTSSFVDSTRIVRWMMGGLEAIPRGDLARAGIIVAAGLALLVWIVRDLNALAAGEEAAASVGVPVDRTVRIAFVAGSAIVAAVVAVAGPIGFVGIVVPHAVRALVGADHRVLLPASILGGAGFVLLADTAARLILWPAQIPVGIVTALLGAPFFLILLLGEKGRARLWGG